MLRLMARNETVNRTILVKLLAEGGLDIGF